MKTELHWPSFIINSMQVMNIVKTQRQPAIRLYIIFSRFLLDSVVAVVEELVEGLAVLELVEGLALVVVVVVTSATEDGLSGFYSACTV